MQTRRRRLRPAVFLVFALVGAVAGGCASGSGPSPASSAAPPSAAPSVAATAAPSVDPNGSVGIGLPPDDPGAADPGGRIVVPRPGQLDVHVVPAQSLAAAVDGRRVVVTVTYTSGVEPCYVLDTIVVQRGDHAFAITLREGHEPGNAVCIEIAQTKRTTIDLGELDPGTWTISDAQGGAAPITVTIA